MGTDTAAKPVATRDAYGRTLEALGAEREDIVVLDADLSGSTRTGWFAKKYPERFFNMGVAEQNMMGVAAGLALAGKLPFVSTFSIFATERALEPIRQNFAYPNLKVRVVVSHAGITVGEDGGSHQTVEDIALMRVLPNMRVIVPADGPQTAAAIRATLDYDGPVFIRTGRAAVPIIYGDNAEFALGKADVLREGSDVTIVACGIMTAPALEAADRLAGDGISAEVINSASIKPLDVDTIAASARKTGAVVTAEEHSIIGGLGGAVAEALAENAPTKMKRVGLQDVFGQSGTADALLDHYGLNAAGIVEAAKGLL